MSLMRASAAQLGESKVVEVVDSSQDDISPHALHDFGIEEMIKKLCTDLENPKNNTKLS